MRKVLRFLSLPYEKKKLLGQSLLIVSAIRLSLWLFSFRRLNRWLSRFDKVGLADNSENDWAVIANVVSAVRACSRYVPYASCLTQALATRTLLQLSRQNSQLKIGVEKDEREQFAAHAWLEVNEKIIIGRVPRHQRYTVLNSSDSVVI